MNNSVVVPPPSLFVGEPASSAPPERRDCLVRERTSARRRLHRSATNRNRELKRNAVAAARTLAFLQTPRRPGPLRIRRHTQRSNQPPPTCECRWRAFSNVVGGSERQSLGVQHGGRGQAGAAGVFTCRAPTTARATTLRTTTRSWEGAGDNHTLGLGRHTTQICRRAPSASRWGSPSTRPCNG